MESTLKYKVLLHTFEISNRSKKIMQTSDLKKLQYQTILSSVVLAVGFMLLVFMIITEDEPGAIPLLLILTGTIWFFITHLRKRSWRKLNEENLSN